MCPSAQTERSFQLFDMAQRHSLEKKPDQSRGPRKSPARDKKSTAPRLAEATLTDLQHKVGNRALSELLDSDTRNADHAAGVESPLVQEVLSSSSAPMKSTTRADMEDKFQEDFNNVRIHTDAKANESARILNAHAYTKGEHLVFNKGEFAPGTAHGERVLTHELAHVVEQRRKRSAATVRRYPLPPAAPDPEKELGEKLVGQFPTGVAVAFYDHNLDEAERRAQDWATDQNAIGIKGTKVQADKIVFGKPIPDTSEIKTTLPALAAVLAAAVAKASSPGNAPATKTNSAKIKLLAIFSHGTSNWCGIGGGLTGSNAAATIKSITPVVSSDLKVLLYSCSGAQGPTEPYDEWFKGTLEGGGVGSVASKIRDAMVAEGIAQGEVWGHTTVGHISENFALRYFTASSGKEGQGLAYAGSYVWGTSTRLGFLAELQKLAESKGYLIDDKNSKRFLAEAANATNKLMYSCYATANKTETYNGKNLAIAAPMNPTEVAAVIQKLWSSKYWTTEKKDEIAEKVIKAAGLKKPKL
jgi:uncharacterized protein DUF4157